LATIEEAVRMGILRAIKSLCGCVGHVIQEAYCALGQKVGERLEDASDAIAEQRYLAKQRAEHSAPTSSPAQQLVDITSHPVINGFKHPN
jgi:hypothetical protein